METVTHSHARPAPEVKSAEPGLEDAFDEFRRTFETFKDGQRPEARRAAAEVLRRRGDRREGRAHLEGARRAEAGDRPVRAERPPAAARHRRARARRSNARAQGGLRRLCARRRRGRAAADRAEGARRSAPPTAATSCPRRPSARSAAGSRRCRRSAASPASARCRPTSTRSPSRSPAPRPAGSARPRPRPETDAPTLAELAFPAMELYAMPAATATLLDDAAVNIDEWIAEEVETAFADAGGHRLRHRRRHQQAEGLPRLHQGRRGELGLDQDRLHRHRRLRRLRRRRTRPTS